MDKKSKIVVIICVIIILVLIGIVTSYALIKNNNEVLSRDVIPESPITVQSFKDISDM